MNMNIIGAQFLFKDRLGLNPSQMQVYLSIINMPYILVFIYGVISDYLPLFGYKRKSYIFICAII